MCREIYLLGQYQACSSEPYVKINLSSEMVVMSPGTALTESLVKWHFRLQSCWAAKLRQSSAPLQFHFQRVNSEELQLLKTVVPNYHSPPTLQYRHFAKTFIKLSFCCTACIQEVCLTWPGTQCVRHQVTLLHQ